jgi:hypothetical protein
MPRAWQTPPTGLVPKPVPVAAVPAETPETPDSSWTVAQLDEFAAGDEGYPSSANKAEKQAYLGVTTKED